MNLYLFFYKRLFRNLFIFHISTLLLALQFMRGSPVCVCIRSCICDLHSYLWFQLMFPLVMTKMNMRHVMGSDKNVLAKQMKMYIVFICISIFICDLYLWSVFVICVLIYVCYCVYDSDKNVVAEQMKDESAYWELC